MNVEIITIIDHNHGNRLQNYALQQFLLKMGMNVRTSRPHRQRCVALRQIRDRLLCICRKTDSDLFHYFDTKIVWKDPSLPAVCDDGQIDCYIAGSDQIWNPNFSTTTDREFLLFAPPHKRVAYAGSFGIDTLPMNLHQQYRHHLSAFKSLSVREAAGQRLIRELCGLDVPVLPDPALLLEADEWEELAASSVLKIKEPYVVKYFLGSRNGEYEALIEEYARRHACRVIDITQHQSSGVRGIGPCEFVDLFCHCQAAFGDSFHGAIFSILFRKPFLFFRRPAEKGYGDMSSRFDTLLSLLGLADRYADCAAKAAVMDQPIDYDRVHRIVHSERERAAQYLKSVLT